MNERKTAHTTFVIERTFASPPAQGTNMLIDNLEAALRMVK